MNILSHLKTPIDYFRKPDSRRLAVEKEMLSLVRAVKERACKSKKWNFSPEVEDLQGNIGVLFDQCVGDYATLDDFRNAVKMWEAAGTR